MMGELGERILLQTQIDLIRDITGYANDMGEETAKIHKAQWSDCLVNNIDNDYNKNFLPNVMKKYHDVWSSTTINPNATVIRRSDFTKIKKEIVQLLQYSYVIPLEEGSSIIPRRSKRGLSEESSSEEEDDTNEYEQQQVTPPIRKRTRRGAKNQPDSLSSLPPAGGAANVTGTQHRRHRLHGRGDTEPTNSLATIPTIDPAAVAAAKAKEEAAKVKTRIQEEMQLGNMKKSWDDDSDEYIRVASLEVAAREVCIGNNRRPIANAKISSLGGKILSRQEYDALESISDLGGRARKFDQLKDYINEGMTRVKGLTHIKKDQLILEWISTHTRIQNGETLPRPLRTINKSNSQLSLTHEIAHILRHIIICYGISMTKIIGLLNCTAVLHLGRPLSEEEFPSTASLRLWMPALDKIDRHDRDELDKKTFGSKKSEYGFPVLYYFVSDDSVFAKHDKRHGVIRSGVYEDGRPKYVVMTSGKAASADAEGNSDLNLHVLKESVDEAVLPFIGGATVDGASSAHKEIHETFDKLMDELDSKATEEENARLEDTEMGDTEEENESAVPNHSYFYGVKRQEVLIPDGFHADNVAVNSASVAFSGLPERNNLRQFHPMTFLEHIHDIHSVNPTFSQQLMDDVIREHHDYLKENHSNLLKYILKTVRERKQRWRVNGLYAMRILEAMNVTLPSPNGNTNLITEWARKMQWYGGTLTGADSQWMKEVAEAVAIMSQSKSILISLTFEMELVTQYFDITHGEHATSGEFGRRSGFITMELHFLLFDFIVPFWLSAVENPASRFPQTAELIEALENEDMKAMKKEQLQAAVDCALEKISKNMELMLDAPLIFLLLTHPTEGPKVLRAILGCLEEAEFDINESENVYTDEYDDDMDIEDFPPLNIDKESDVYFAHLLPQAKKVAHFFRQFGLARLIVRDELIQLSKQETPSTNSEKGRLDDFKKKYPIIFDALHSAFGYSSSNSRIIELLHGFVRSFYDSQTPLEFLDAKLRYLMDKEHQDREERRNMTKKKRDKKSAHKQVKHLDDKPKCAKQGQQLCTSSQRYLTHEIEALPNKLRKEILIRALKEIGTTQKEKEYESIVKVKSEEKGRAKRRRGVDMMDLETTRQKADQTTTEHDKTWHNKEQRAYHFILEKVATTTHFKSIPMANGGNDFYEEIEKVLPCLDTEKLWMEKKNNRVRVPKKDLTASAAKGGVIGPHLALIKDIAKKKTPNTLNEVDVSGMTYEDALAEFVKADQSKKLTKLKQELENKWKKTKAIFNAATGGIIRQHYLKKLKEASTADPHDVEEEVVVDYGDSTVEEEEGEELEVLEE